MHKSAFGVCLRDKSSAMPLPAEYNTVQR